MGQLANLLLPPHIPTEKIIIIMKLKPFVPYLTYRQSALKAGPKCIPLKSFQVNALTVSFYLFIAAFFRVCINSRMAIRLPFVVTFE